MPLQTVAGEGMEDMVYDPRIVPGGTEQGLDIVFPVALGLRPGVLLHYLDEPRVQQVVDILKMIIECVMPDARGLGEGRHGDLIKRCGLFLFAKQ